MAASIDGKTRPIELNTILTTSVFRCVQLSPFMRVVLDASESLSRLHLPQLLCTRLELVLKQHLHDGI